MNSTSLIKPCLIFGEVAVNCIMAKVHPYGLRLRIREHLPWFLINMGLAAKGRDCNEVGDGLSACYYCKVLEVGQLGRN